MNEVDTNIENIQGGKIVFAEDVVATIAFLALGTAVFPDKPEERAEVEAFFRQITTPANG